MERISTTISFEMDCHGVVQSSLSTAIDIEKSLSFYSRCTFHAQSRRKLYCLSIFRFFYRLCTSVLATIQWNVVSQNECGSRFHAPISLPCFFSSTGAWRIKNTKNPNLRNAKCKCECREWLFIDAYLTHQHRINTNQWNIGHRTSEHSHHTNIYAFHFY